MGCEEKQRLVGDYEAATRQFAGSVTELNRKLGISPTAEYERLRRIVDEARVRSEQARLALEQHTAAHSC
jgi:hypothetical protein